jgi:hypothetical protein
MVVMSDDNPGFVAPPFKPDTALAALQRALRDAKLSSRGNGFELRGKRVVELTLEAGGISARLARKLALTPEFDRFTVTNATEQRRFTDELKKRLARWDSGDE